MKDVLLREVCDFSEADYRTVCHFLKQLSEMPRVLTIESFKELIEAPQSHLLILESNEKTIGMITIAVYPVPTGRKAWVEDVVIDSSFRGEGLGRCLLEQALDYSRQVLQVDSLLLTSRPSRIAANALYRTLGFQQRETNVYKMNL